MLILVLLLYSLSLRSERTHFLGGNLFVEYPKRSFNFVKFHYCNSRSSVKFPLYATTNKNESNTRVSSRQNFAKQTNTLQKFVNNDDFHDYIVNINLPAHGVEFLWLDDPKYSQNANTRHCTETRIVKKKYMYMHMKYIYALCVHCQWHFIVNVCMFVCLSKNP